MKSRPGMKNHQLTSRFIKSIELLKTKKIIPSKRQFAIQIGVHPQCISDIMTGKRDVNLDILVKAAQRFDLNYAYLFKGEGNLFNSAEEPDPSPQSEPILSIVTDQTGKERIVHVPYAAHAGYVDQLNDPVFIKELPTFSLPDKRFEMASHRCFDVVGDSMEPLLFSGDKIVCEFIEPDHWINMKSGHVYVIVTTDSILVKRIKNNIKKEALLELQSDNNFYEMTSMEVAELKEVWQVTYKISTFLHSPTNVRNGLHTEMDSLRSTISDQGEIIQSLNSTIEKLLRQSRRELTA